MICVLDKNQLLIIQVQCLSLMVSKGKYGFIILSYLTFSSMTTWSLVHTKYNSEKPKGGYKCWSIQEFWIYNEWKYETNEENVKLQRRIWILQDTQYNVHLYKYNKEFNSISFEEKSVLLEQVLQDLTINESWTLTYCNGAQLAAYTVTWSSYIHRAI